MLEFNIDQERCTRCGLCLKDCVVGIIEMGPSGPEIHRRKKAACVGCQHCLAVCPTAAVSILGRTPEESRPLNGALPSPDHLEILIKGRRSVRHYRDENLDPELLQRLLDVAWQAPTGHNARQVRFSVIDNKDALRVFREETYRGLDDLISSGNLPKEMAFFRDFARLWRDQGVDVLFRGAPHLIVASAPKSCASPIPDSLIALSYFELFAQSLGVGTVWNGLVKWAIDDLVPQLRSSLRIPEDHLIGYAMAFGKPSFPYQRTVENRVANIERFIP